MQTRIIVFLPYRSKRKRDTVRKQLLSLILTCASIISLKAQPTNCSSIAEYPIGRQWVYQWYGANQKPSFQTFRTVAQSSQEGQSATIALKVVDVFTDTLFTGSYQVSCTEAGLYQDLLSKLTPDMLSSLQGLRLASQEDGWRLPHGMHPGDEIPQSYAHLTGFDGNTQVIELDLSIGPVGILEQEDLSTPAGGFPCVAMAYELWVTTVIRKRFRLRDWFSPGIGVIRREVFDRKGRFYGYCELVSFRSGV